MYEPLHIVQNPIYAASFAQCLALSGALNDRTDAAGDTLHLARELEQVSAESYDVLKNPRIGRTLVPFVNELQDGAESYSWDVYDGIARAEWIVNWASVVGGTSANKHRFTIPTRSFGSHYQYTDEDLARAVMAGGRGLDREVARMARIAHEQFFDDLIADGDSERDIPGMPGLLAALGFTEQAPYTANSPWIAPVVGTWDDSTTGPEKLKDLQALVDTPEQNTKQLFKANRLVLPLSVKPLMTAPWSATSVSAETVEAVFLKNQPANGVKSIDYWYKLDTKSALGGPRAISYFAAPTTFKFVYAYDYRELAPQRVAYATQVLTKAKLAGLVSVYPLAMAQMDLDS